jgi:HPt (histidine-containing phosphotransfer) domain-containing protein
MMEMISLFLDQTPSLVSVMKKSAEEKDWRSLQAVAHKMIPSFSIVGINQTYENIARRIQEDASKEQNAENIPALVAQLEEMFLHACGELEDEYNTIKKMKA